MYKQKNYAGPIIIRSIIIALSCALAVLFCISLSRENKRMSSTVPADGFSRSVGDGDELVQELHIDDGENSLKGVALLFSLDAFNPQGEVIISVERDGERIAEWIRDGRSIHDTDFEYFFFDKEEFTAGHDYKLKVELDGFGQIKPFSFPLGSSDKDQPSLINGTSTGKTVCYRNIYDALLFWQMILIPVIIFVSFLLWQGLYYSLIKPRFGIGETGDFASVYIALLIFYFILVPLNSVFDEENHFKRSYSIAHGNLIADSLTDNRVGGDVLPESVDKYASLYMLNYDHDGKRQNDEPLKVLKADWDHVKETTFPNTAINVPFLYFPQAVGMRIAEFFTPSLYYIAYSGRLLNMVITALLVLLAVRLAPAGKNYFKFTALLPMMMQQSVSLAPDGFITALIMVYIAFILKARLDKMKPMDLKQFVILYILTVLVVMSKLVYAPLCLLLFLIPSEMFGKKSRYAASVGIVAVTVIVFMFSWMLILQRYNLRFQSSDSSLQMEFIIREPLKAACVFGKYLMDSGKYTLELFGQTLGCANIPLPSFVPVIFIFIAALWCYRYFRITGEKNGKERFIFALSMVLAYFAVGVAEYLGWTMVGAPQIEGVSGRYLLQLVPLFMFFISGIKTEGLISKRFRERMTFVCVLMNMFALVTYWIYTVY